MTYTTIQRRHAAKWLTRVTKVRAFTVDNGFSGKECQVSAPQFAVERLGDNLQVNAIRTARKLRSHSNYWYEFDLEAAS